MPTTMAMAMATVGTLITDMPITMGQAIMGWGRRTSGGSSSPS
jgi:hypothetical protein